MVESLPSVPLLLLVNYRPEYQHSWGSKTYYTQLRLDPLQPASADAYFPLIDLLKRYAHVEEGDDTRTVRAKLTGQVLTLDEALHEVTPALLALFDVLPDDHAFHQGTHTLFQKEWIPFCPSNQKFFEWFQTRVIPQ